MASVLIYAKGVIAQRLDGLKIDDRYQLVDRSGATPTIVDGSHHINALGGGGYGVVVRAHDLVGLSRAIKFLKQPDYMFDESSSGTNLFVREIRLTNERPYKHIIPILDYGSVRVGKSSVSYYVSQFVDGLTLRDFCDLLSKVRHDVMRDDILRARVRDLMLTILRDVLSGLVELSAASVVHMDLKHDNILIHPIAKQQDGSVTPERLLQHIKNTELHAFVIDLGAGKPIEGSASGRTTLRHTRYFFPPIKDELGIGADDKIDYESLIEYWRVIDLYCLGRTVEWIFFDRVRRKTHGVTPNGELARTEEAKETFWRLIFNDDLDVLEGLVDKLMALREGFSDAADALQAFETISLASARSIFESDLLIGRTPVSHTPVGSVGVHVGSPFDRILRHPTFQRLRWIQQLAFVSEVYPDGTHTRYAHSLRCYEMARRAVMGLGRRSAFRLLFQRRDVEELLAAALLHDIGQYHFAHSIEDLKKLGDRTNDPELALIQHDQDLAREMCQVPDAEGVSIEQLITNDCHLQSNNIYYMISKGARVRSLPSTVNISRDIVNGVVDVDRIAYLKHDSERTGVPYGSAIDENKLIDSLTLYVDAAAGADRVGLGVEEFGVSAVEAVLAGVYWMYREIYWMEENRAFMAAVKFVAMRLFRTKLLRFSAFREQTFAKTDWHALNILSESYDNYVRAHGGLNPVARLAAQQGLGYGAIFTLGYGGGDKKLYARIVRGITADRLEELAVAVREFVGRDTTNIDGDVLVDVPLKRRLHATGTSDDETERETGAASHLWVCSRTSISKTIQRWTDIREYSVLAGALAAVEDHSGRRIRVFASDELLARMSPRSRQRIETGLRPLVDEYTAGWEAS